MRMSVRTMTEMKIVEKKGGGRDRKKGRRGAGAVCMGGGEKQRAGKAI